MDKQKQKRLAEAGWRVGSTAEFLGLTPEEELHLVIKLALASAVRARRTKLRLTQAQLAERLGSSQSRVANIEAGDRSVSHDLLVQSLIELGATRRDLARVLGQAA
jgi:predicted XRE-type DNA-binding protein